MGSYRARHAARGDPVTRLMTPRAAETHTHTPRKVLELEQVMEQVMVKKSRCFLGGILSGVRQGQGQGPQGRQP
jgi:hypothetical protein